MREREKDAGVVRINKDRSVDIDDESYWSRYEEIGLEHLLHCIERDTLHTLYRQVFPLPSGGAA